MKYARVPVESAANLVALVGRTMPAGMEPADARWTNAAASLGYRHHADAVARQYSICGHAGEKQ